MEIVRYVDIYKTQDIDGQLVDVVSLRDATLPIIIDESRVNAVQPYFSSKGKIFKNVSYLNYDGELMKVVGNYRKLDKAIKDYSRDTRKPIKGFKNE